MLSPEGLHMLKSLLDEQQAWGAFYTVLQPGTLGLNAALLLLVLELRVPTLY